MAQKCATIKEVLSERREQMVAEDVHTWECLVTAIYVALFSGDDNYFTVTKHGDGWHLDFLTCTDEMEEVSRHVGFPMLNAPAAASIIETAVLFVAQNEYGGNGHPRNVYDNYTREERPKFWERLEFFLTQLLAQAWYFRREDALELTQIHEKSGNESGVIENKLRAARFDIDDGLWDPEMKEWVRLYTQTGYRLLFDKLFEYWHEISLGEPLPEPVEALGLYRDNHDKPKEYQEQWLAEWATLDATPCGPEGPIIAHDNRTFLVN